MKTTQNTFPQHETNNFHFHQHFTIQKLIQAAKKTEVVKGVIDVCPESMPEARHISEHMEEGKTGATEKEKKPLIILAI